MIPEVTVTLTVPADRLTDLQAFCQETDTSVPGNLAPSTEPEEKPKRGRGRPKGAKNKPKPEPTPEPTPEPEPEPEPEPHQGDVEAVAAEAALKNDETPAEEATDAPTLDDAKAAVQARITSHGLDSVKSILAEFTAAKLSDLDPKDYAAVIEKLKGE